MVNNLSSIPQDSVFSSGGSSQEGGSPMTETPPPVHTWGQSHTHTSTPDDRTRGTSSSSRTDLPDWYSQNGTDGTDAAAAASRVSGRMPPGQRSWHGSRDYVDDGEFTQYCVLEVDMVLETWEIMGYGGITNKGRVFVYFLGGGGGNIKSVVQSKCSFTQEPTLVHPLSLVIAFPQGVEVLMHTYSLPTWTVIW